MFITIKSCNPNRHGTVSLICETTQSVDFYIVKYPGVDEQEEDEFDCLAKAEDRYEAIVERLSKMPNWDAQAAYDEEHGTDNGYADFQYGREY